MRIAHLSDAYHPRMGGIESQVARLAAQQAAEGHSVEVFTTTPGDRGAHGASSEREGRVTVHRLAARLPGGFPIHPRAARYITARLTARRPDIVHAHIGMVTPSVQATLPSLVRAQLPVVVTVHSMWGSAEAGFRALDRLIHWSTWPVVWSAVSEQAAAPLHRIVAPAGVVLTIPNGIDAGMWRVNRVPRIARAHGGVHVVGATRFAPRKRVIPLVTAIKSATERLPDRSLRVTIAGTGPQWETVRAMVAALGLGSVIALPGRLDMAALKDLYAQGDVFAAPSIHESFGIAALEAQAAGLAVLTRSQSAIAERIVDGVNGFVVDDDTQFADVLARLGAEPALADQMVGASGQAPEGCDWSAVTAVAESAYRTARLLRGLR